MCTLSFFFNLSLNLTISIVLFFQVLQNFQKWHLFKYYCIFPRQSFSPLENHTPIHKLCLLERTCLPIYHLIVHRDNHPSHVLSISLSLIGLLLSLSSPGLILYNRSRLAPCRCTTPTVLISIKYIHSLFFVFSDRFKKETCYITYRFRESKSLLQIIILAKVSIITDLFNHFTCRCRTDVSDCDLRNIILLLGYVFSLYLQVVWETVIL